MYCASLIVLKEQSTTVVSESNRKTEETRIRAQVEQLQQQLRLVRSGALDAEIAEDIKRRLKFEEKAVCSSSCSHEEGPGIPK